jgi:hypothetical protein
MDCKTARMLVAFDRPNAGELEPRDVQDLADHLNRCPACGAAAQADRSLDHRLGQAMCQVDVPKDLHKNILLRLDAERGARYRRRLGYAVRAAAIAAVVLVGVFGLYRWLRPGPTRINLDDLCGDVSSFRMSPTVERVQEKVRGLRADAAVPTGLRYDYLAAPPALTTIGDKEVPVLAFVHPRPADVARERVWVYLLDDRFDLASLPASFSASDSFHSRVSVVRQDDRHAYLVLYTGDSWDWLRARPAEEPSE